MENNFKILFTGDISLTGVFGEKVRLNEEIFSEEIIQLLKSADFVVCNFEGPATEKDTLQGNGVRLASPKNSIEYLSKRNIKVFNLANNHLFDCGLEGFVDTKAEIGSNASYYFGAGVNLSEASNFLCLQKNGISISLIGICQNVGLIASAKSAGIFTLKHHNKLKEAIKQASKKSNFVIINYHGGEEFTLYPSPYKRRILKKIAKYRGSNLIMAHHSHTFQGIAKVDEKRIFYSLGNFIFDFEPHDFFNYTDQSAIVEINVTKTGYKYQIHPFKINKSKEVIERADSSMLQHVEKISNFSNYYKKWREESYRVLFKRKESDSNISLKKTLQKMSFMEIILNPGFYRKGLSVFTNINLRSIYINALIYKFLLKFQKTK